MERFFAHVQLFRKWRGEAPLRTPPRQRHSPADEGVGSTRAGDVEDATCGIGHQGRLFDRGLFTRGGRHFHRTRRGGDRTDDTDKVSGIRVISGCHFHPLRVRWRPMFSCSENGATTRHFQDRFRRAWPPRATGRAHLMITISRKTKHGASPHPEGDENRCTVPLDIGIPPASVGKMPALSVAISRFKMAGAHAPDGERRRAASPFLAEKVCSSPRRRKNRWRGRWLTVCRPCRPAAAWHVPDAVG